jgi:hypothetical protein
MEDNTASLDIRAINEKIDGSIASDNKTICE